MRRVVLVAAALALSLGVGVGMAAIGSGARASDPQPFERGSWAKIRAAHAGQPTVFHFWGLTCGPCLVELPHWGKLLGQRRDLRLVLVAADPLPQPAVTAPRAGASPIASTRSCVSRSIRAGPASCPAR